MPDPHPAGELPQTTADINAQIEQTPAWWLLSLAAQSGIPLTQTYALARAVVREAAERWPHWWDAELFGPPHREAELAPLQSLREGLRRLRLVRRQARVLHASTAERKHSAEDRGQWRSQIALSCAARGVLTPGIEAVSGAQILVFDIELVSALGDPIQGVNSAVAVSSVGHMTVLHDAIRMAFGWADDHLYSFWLDGSFWGDPDTELARPGAPENEAATADVPIAELDFDVGRRIAYVFDYGDEWRVLLTLRQCRGDGKPLLRVIERNGIPSPLHAPVSEGD